MRKKTIVSLIVGIAAVAAMLTGVYYVGRRIELAAYIEESVPLVMPSAAPVSVTVGEREYILRNNLTTILVMGIDKTSTAMLEDGEYPSFRNQGQADFLLLFVIDAEQKKVTRLMLDRDTLTQITTLGIFGNVSGTRLERLSLSHSFGDGKEQSCELTAEAVSRFLLGMKIDYYIALNLDAIPKLNDAVGGVTVTLEDDFSAYDPLFTAGATVTLKGEQTAWYVRSRLDIGVGTNESRMLRQRVYLNELAGLIAAEVETNLNFAGALFDTLKDDLITNMSRGRMINEIHRAIGYEARALETLPGEHTIDSEGFMEFRAEEPEVEQWVLNTFCTPSTTQ
jgi:LCP family protein required for cell wall assembly